MCLICVFTLSQGHNSPREFIVTQGPLHSTRDDFWRMVWESNSRAIVMLTRCIEKGREKCDHYWPVDTLPVYYGDICVTILNETHYPDWSITEFMLCRVSGRIVLPVTLLAPFDTVYRRSFVELHVSFHATPAPSTET